MSRLGAHLTRTAVITCVLLGFSLSAQAAKFMAACVVLVTQRDAMWNQELAALSPVSATDQALDMSMRADLGAPDVRYLVVVSAASQETVLAASERAAAVLQQLQAAGVIDGFESPAFYLPSQATQRQRLASLPPDAELRRRFKAAVADLPVRPERFGPFFADVATARGQRPLTRQDLVGSSLAQGVDALLPLRAGSDAGLDAARLRAALARTGLADVHFVDIKGEADRLYQGYLREAILLSLAGLAAITGQRPQFFRPTAGLHNPFLEPILARHGLHLASWTRRGFDTRNRDVDDVTWRLTRDLAAGDILLLHDGNAARSNTPAAAGQPVILSVLPRVLEAAATAGLKSITLGAALAISKP